MAGYQTGTDNQMTNDGTCTYTYDAAGNMTQKSKGDGLETWYYGYDNLNRLTSVRETRNGTTNDADGDVHLRRGGQPGRGGQVADGRVGDDGAVRLRRGERVGRP